MPIVKSADYIVNIKRQIFHCRNISFLQNQPFVLTFDCSPSDKIPTSARQAVLIVNMKSCCQVILKS